MKRSPKDERAHAATDAMRDQEVLRANKELAAYFQGLRTEREARAALKIIKAFIKERERLDAARRRPLPGLKPVAVPARAAVRTRKKGSAAAARASRRRAAEHTASVRDEQPAEIEAIVGLSDDEASDRTPD
jgi:hypothetical protein